MSEVPNISNQESSEQQINIENQKTEFRELLQYVSDNIFKKLSEQGFDFRKFQSPDKITSEERRVLFDILLPYQIAKLDTNELYSRTISTFTDNEIKNFFAANGVTIAKDAFQVFMNIFFYIDLSLIGSYIEVATKNIKNMSEIINANNYKRLETLNSILNSVSSVDILDHSFLSKRSIVMSGFLATFSDKMRRKGQVNSADILNKFLFPANRTQILFLIERIIADPLTKTLDSEERINMFKTDYYRPYLSGVSIDLIREKDINYHGVSSIIKYPFPSNLEHHNGKAYNSVFVELAKAGHAIAKSPFLFVEPSNSTKTTEYLSSYDSQLEVVKSYAAIRAEIKLQLPNIDFNNIIDIGQLTEEDRKKLFNILLDMQRDELSESALFIGKLLDENNKHKLEMLSVALKMSVEDIESTISIIKKLAKIKVKESLADIHSFCSMWLSKNSLTFLP